MDRRLLIRSMLVSSILLGGTRLQTQTPQSKGKNLNGSPGVSIVQGEKNTNWDCQSYGGDERHLWVLPDGSVHAVYYGNTGTITDASGNGLHSFYCYSPDSGRTFTKPVCVEAEVANFPAMAVTPDGRALIASSRGKSPVGIAINVDSSRGSGKFTLFKIPDNPKYGVYPRLSVVSESLAVFIGLSMKTKENIWNVFNFKTNTFLHDTNLVAFPGIKNKNSITVTSNRAGKVAMLLSNACGLPLSGVPGENNLWIQESSDGGLTWGEAIPKTQLSSQPIGSQTMLWWTSSALYVGNELHVVWGETVIPENGEFGDGLERIIHWAKGVNDGVPTVAGKMGFTPFWTKIYVWHNRNSTHRKG